MVEIRLNDVSQMFEGREVLHQLTHSFHGGCVTAIAGVNAAGNRRFCALRHGSYSRHLGLLIHFWMVLL